MGSRKIIKCLKENCQFFQILSIFTETEGFSAQRGKRLPNSEVKPFEKSSAYFQTGSDEPLRPADDSICNLRYSSLLSCFDNLTIN